MNKVLFWDFDGTLSYPNSCFSNCLSQALSRYGYAIPENKIAAFMADFYSWKTPEIIYPERTHALWWDAHFEKVKDFCSENAVDKAKTRDICHALREILIDITNYKLYEDTVSTLEACRRKGYKNYLVTNNYPEITENLKKLGIASYFTDFIISSHIGYEKPHEAFFAYAKRIAGNPELAYVIGDNPIADIQGGKAAGFTTIAVHLCCESAADHYCESLRQIIDLLP